MGVLGRVEYGRFIGAFVGQLQKRGVVLDQVPNLFEISGRGGVEKVFLFGCLETVVVE